MLQHKVPRAQARSAIVEAAIRHLSLVGPAAVQPKEICEELGLSKALVNYHFGGRDGLIGEALALGYERYVDTILEISEQAGPDPVERLLAWIDAHVEWASKHSGLAAGVSFPHAAAGMPDGLSAEVHERIAAAGARNFRNLEQLVRAARIALHANDPAAGADATAVSLDAAVVGWLTMGMAVWHAGGHLPTRGIEARNFVEIGSQHMREAVVALLAR